jgi:hypothetical protein
MSSRSLNIDRDAIFIMTSNLASEEIANYAERLRREVKAKMRERYAKIVSEKSHADKVRFCHFYYIRWERFSIRCGEKVAS